MAKLKSDEHVLMDGAVFGYAGVKKYPLLLCEHRVLHQTHRSLAKCGSSASRPVVFPCQILNLMSLFVFVFDPIPVSLFSFN
ncbi:MAG: hypothetical protein WCO04_11105 [Pseudomonadota bacterium]